MKTLILNAKIWDGSGAAAYTGELLIDGQRIDAVSRGPLPPTQTEGATRIDARGMTLMPGLVEGHAHLSFCGATKNTDLGDIPPEEHVLETMHNARTLLEAGFTSAFSAASAKMRLDVVVRNQIEAGRIPGPRLRAAGPEITVTGGLGDDNRLHMDRLSFGLVADGPEAIARAVRLCIREGVDTVKLNISGDDFVPAAKGGMTVMREDEVRMACEVAHSLGKKVASHSRASGSVLRALQCGVDVIYHCEFADNQALDALEAARERIFLGPAIGLIHKIRAYALQDEGQDTVEANESLGFQADQRDYGIGAQILAELGVQKLRMMTNNPRKFVGLEGYGLEITERISIEIAPTDISRRYLETKKKKLGHLLREV